MLTHNMLSSKLFKIHSHHSYRIVSYRGIGHRLTAFESTLLCYLSTLHYRCIFGHVIKAYKIITGKYDPLLSPNMTTVSMCDTKESDMQLQKIRVNMLYRNIVLLI